MELDRCWGTHSSGSPMAEIRSWASSMQRRKSRGVDHWQYVERLSYRSSITLIAENAAMACTSQGSLKNRNSSAREITLVAFSLALGWVWLVAGTRLHEMIVGAAAVLLATLFSPLAVECY